MEHAVSQLIKKKKDLKGQLEFYKKSIPKLEEVIRSINISIKIFDADFDVNSIKAKEYTLRTSYFKHGEVKTMILDVLRKANTPMSTPNIAMELMKIKKLDYTDKTVQTLVKQTTLNALNRLHKSGILDKNDTIGIRSLLWSIA